MSVEHVTSVLSGTVGNEPSSLYIMKLLAGSPALMMLMSGLPTCVPSMLDVCSAAGWPTVEAMMAAIWAVVGAACATEVPRYGW